MGTVYVVHAPPDHGFVVGEVLPPLPSHGFGCWLTRRHSSLQGGGPQDPLPQCAAALVVWSPASPADPDFSPEVDAVLAARLPLVVVVRGAPAARPERLLPLPTVDCTLEASGAASRLLAALLPTLEPAQARAAPPAGAERIAWDTGIFSDALLDATRRHDHARARSLVDAHAAHLALRGAAEPYPAQPACADLQALRQDREFELMRRYAEAAIASGTRHDRVARLYAQALIETRDHPRALAVLQGIIDAPDASAGEVAEAHGLIGRSYKQRYVDAPQAPGAAELLRRAIQAYESVYARDPQQAWHGVNAASCMQRAERDGIAAAPPGRAREIAEQIAEALSAQAEAGPLPVWDCASRVEALLALGRDAEAQAALETYLHHPDMQAFEVSSTHRQFDQVLQLGRSEAGREILARLQQTVERYRAGKLDPVPAPEAVLTAGGAAAPPPLIPLVIRVADPGWSPLGVPDLTLQSRLGTIVTARGSAASVRALLADSDVIAVDQSRPAGMAECERSMPYIRVAPSYTHAGNTYEERGDAALVAIIDDGIDVLHQAFRDAAGRCRIVGIWDQSAVAGMPPAGFGYGAYHDAATIAGWVSANAVPAALGRNDDGHGTHVASIAGGRAAGEFAGGVAPDAPLLIVVSQAQGPVGYSASHIEALAFIDRQATERGLPVVVNLSEGMNAGAHDGKSALEVAFDAFSQSGRRPGRVIVKSAGNERAKGGHARVTLGQGGAEELRWKRLPGADMTERVELWWTKGDDFRFRLVGPAGAASEWAGATAPEVQGTFPTDGPYRLVYTPLHVDNGDNLLLVELGDAAAPAAKGEWRLDIENVAFSRGGELHAWIERTLGAPSTFVNHASEDLTLSVPGTAASVITVGAVEAAKPLRVGAFSSYGPTRDGRDVPLVCAPGVKVRAARGATEHDAMSKDGTSMAAPHVAGAIALVLSRAKKKGGRIPNAVQIGAVLQTKAQNYSGRWDRGQGYGVVDVAALLATFE